MGRVGELLVILAIVFLLFGSRRLKDLGSDLGSAIKGFKSQIGDDKQLTNQSSALASAPVTEVLPAEKNQI